MRYRLPAKHPAESKLVTLPYAKDMRPGTSFISVVLQSVVVSRGVDPSATLVLDGVPLPDAVNRCAYQVVHGGVLDCDYDIDYLATDSDGRRHICQFTLPVRATV